MCLCVCKWEFGVEEAERIAPFRPHFPTTASPIHLPLHPFGLVHSLIFSSLPKARSNTFVVTGLPAILPRDRMEGSIHFPQLSPDSLSLSLSLSLTRSLLSSPHCQSQVFSHFLRRTPHPILRQFCRDKWTWVSLAWTRRRVWVTLDMKDTSFPFSFSLSLSHSLKEEYTKSQHPAANSKQT